ncbi:cupin domain-containing protein [Actinomycetospora sp. TBRC 11914]|uniref:cupin domain-containing protein n=1 Tax=Actinomycetospora sp. TBRC 11914 TaxID=2729387 RepID=UPI00145CFFC0|nr:cupin domain-containing protein [Actinomycetospora sp. TBRC 11914]NMO91835.1 cupin [Actinomycetospora sp. TBRC 11914]
MSNPSSTSGDRPYLRRAVAGDLDAFAREAWGRQAVLSRRDDLAKDRGDADGSDGGAGFGDLFSLGAVDELLAHRGLRTPFLRIAKQGKVLDSSSFTGDGGVGAEISDQLRDDRVAALFADGHTVVLQGVHRTWAPVAELAAGLNADLGHPVQVNAYVTPASSTGFAAHYDVHDVFVLQIAGTKRWHVHAPVHPDPLRNQPWDDRAGAVRARAAEEPLLDEVLHPGDALYLPRGFLHSATAQGEVSAHLTVGVHVVTRHALLETLLAGLADDPELRASLPLGVDVSDPAALAPHLETVARRAAEYFADRSRDDDRARRASRRLRGRVWAGNRPESLLPLRQAAAAHALDAESRVRLRHGLRHRVVPPAAADTDAPLRLELPDRTLDLPAAAATPLATLLAGPVVRLGDVAEDEPGDAVVVARRLLVEGVLVTPDSVGPSGAAEGGVPDDRAGTTDT